MIKKNFVNKKKRITGAFVTLNIGFKFRSIGRSTFGRSRFRFPSVKYWV